MIAITIQVGCEPFLPHDLKERGMIQREIFGRLPKDTSWSLCSWWCRWCGSGWGWFSSKHWDLLSELRNLDSYVAIISRCLDVCLRRSSMMMHWYWWGWPYWDRQPFFLYDRFGVGWFGWKSLEVCPRMPDQRQCGEFVDDLAIHFLNEVRCWRL